MPGTGVELSGLTPPKTQIPVEGDAECGALQDEKRSKCPGEPSQDVTTLAELLTALPASDRADIIAGLSHEKRLAVAKLIASRITEGSARG